jgi:hypothetical protein
VVTEMKDILCYSIDAESRAGAPVARRLGVTGYPTLLILEPDGTLRDNIGGYLPPEKFIAEIQRVERNDDTITSMRAALMTKPDDLALRHKFAMKLRGIGDRAGFAEQMAAIKQRDPQGATPTGRRIKFDELYEDIYRSLQKGTERNVDPMSAFLAEETNSELLYNGWALIGMVHEVDALGAKDAGLTEDSQARSTKSREAYRKAWPHTPEVRLATFGNQIAWAFWLSRDHISDEDKAFALSAAVQAAAAAGEEVSVHDTLACCYFMNGELEKALEQVAFCKELDPENPQWDERRAEFTAGG